MHAAEAAAHAAGEREFVKDNKSLGNFRLDGIPPAPRGVPQVEVKFDIDANGILSVTATDKGTKKKQDIKITGASVLSSDEVDRMVSDAEKFADEDKKRRDAVDTKNQARPAFLLAAAWPSAMSSSHACREVFLGELSSLGLPGLDGMHGQQAAVSGSAMSVSC